MSYTPAHLPVNRAAVLTLWAAVMAERLGFGHEEALTLGRALAGLTAHAKGVRLGIFEPASSDEVRERRERLAEGEQLEVQLMGRTIPVVRTQEGLRAITKGEPLKPRSVEQYLINRFSQHLGAVRAAMEELARSLPPGELAQQAFQLYERFRPIVPKGKAGWGAAGALDLGQITTLAKA
jgi:hypothetical protein